WCRCGRTTKKLKAGKRAVNELGWQNIEHPTSNIEHPTSNIQHRTSNIEHPTSNIQRPNARSCRESHSSRVTFGTRFPGEISPQNCNGSPECRERHPDVFNLARHDRGALPTEKSPNADGRDRS